jgi:hypothetical protein
MPSGGGHTAAVLATEVAWGGRMRARIVRTLVSERSWMGFPGQGDHAVAARRSKGASPHVKLTRLGGGCTWHRAQRRMPPAHVHAAAVRGTRLSGWGLSARCLARTSRRGQQAVAAGQRGSDRRRCISELRVPSNGGPDSGEGWVAQSDLVGGPWCSVGRNRCQRLVAGTGHDVGDWGKAMRGWRMGP